MKGMIAAAPAYGLVGIHGNPDEGTAFEVHERIRRGLPRASLRRVGRAVGATGPELAALLGVHARTLSRIERRRSPRLDPELSDRLWRVVAALVRACEALGSFAAAKQWLRQPQYGLAGRVPLTLLSTHAGTELVLQLLGRIEHGIID